MMTVTGGDATVNQCSEVCPLQKHSSHYTRSKAV